MYRFKQGKNGKWYAVFHSEYDAELAAFAFEGCLMACFNGWMNAYEI